MGAKEKKDIKAMVESVKFLAVHDPQGFMILKSNIDVLKARSDMDRLTGSKANDSQLHIGDSRKAESAAAV